MLYSFLEQSEPLEATATGEGMAYKPAKRPIVIAGGAAEEKGGDDVTSVFAAIITIHDRRPNRERTIEAHGVAHIQNVPKTLKMSPHEYCLLVEC